MRKTLLRVAYDEWKARARSNMGKESEMISRRSVFSLLGLAAAVGVAVPTTVLMMSDAEAQTPGMERREDRRDGRQERRDDRREGRDDRREGRQERREDRRTPGAPGAEPADEPEDGKKPAAK